MLHGFFGGPTTTGVQNLRISKNKKGAQKKKVKTNFKCFQHLLGEFLDQYPSDRMCAYEKSIFEPTHIRQAKISKCHV